MKVLSITAWWAWAIVHAGKDIENRTWATKYRGPLLIHASQTVLADDLLEMFAIAVNNAHDPLPTKPASGGIVGRCTLTDCVTAHDSRWFLGPYGFVLAGVQPTPFIPMRGRLGLFDAPPDVIAQLEAAP